MTKFEFLFSVEELPSKSFQTLANFRLNGDLCDVTFIVENMKISAHRVILALNIPYFHEMFINNKAASSAREVTMQMLEPSAFESLIHFAYNCKLKISDDNVKSLLIAASFLQMDEVSDACCKFISKGLDPNSALGIQEFAVTHNLSKLRKLAQNYVQKHFIQISHTNAFLKLTFSDVKDLLKNDGINVISEEVVYQAAMAWVKESVEDREDKLPELLTAVRLPLLNYQFLSACATSEALIQKSSLCLELLQEAKEHCILSDKTLPCSFSRTLRDSCSYADSCDENYIYAVCSLMVEPRRTAVARYGFASGKWEMTKAKTMFIESAAVVAISKCIYVIGGCNIVGSKLDHVLVYDTESDSWNRKASLKKKKTFVSASVCLNSVFVCGGQDEDNCIIADVESYISDKDKWITLPSMLTRRCGASAVYLNENIYVLGGYGAKHRAKIANLSSAERYNSEAKQWVEISPMSSALIFCGATSLNDKIYIHGKEFLEVYEPWLGDWDRVAVVKSYITGTAMLSLSGKLYVVGGSFCNVAHIYDPNADQWNKGEPLPEGLKFIGAAKLSLH